VYSDGKMLPPPFFPRNLNPEAGARALASERGEREGRTVAQSLDEVFGDAGADSRPERERHSY